MDPRWKPSRLARAFTLLGRCEESVRIFWGSHGPMAATRGLTVVPSETSFRVKTPTNTHTLYVHCIYIYIHKYIYTYIHRYIYTYKIICYIHTHTYTSGIQGTHVVHPRQAFTSLQPLQCCVDYPQHVRTQGVRIGFLLTVLRPQPQELLLINMLVSIIYPIIAHHVCISMYIIQIHIIQYYKYYIYTYIYIHIHIWPGMIS